MNMKKLTALILTLAMALSLAACGGNNDSNASTQSPSTPAGGNASTPAPTTGTEAPSYGNHTFIATTSKQENEDGGMILSYFCDYIKEHSNGSISFNISYGGTLCTSKEELDMLESGAVDLACLSTTDFVDRLPLLNFPTMVLGNADTALDYYDYLTFEDANTSSLIQAEAASHNIVYLGFQAGGTTCWLSTKELTCIDDIRGVKFGAAQNQSAFESLGVNVVSFNIPDGYENLSKGVVDAATMAFNPTVAMRWYEVAKNYLMLDTYVAGNPFTLNQNTWNSLNADEQALFREAAEAATTYSLDLANDGYDANMKILTDAGVTVNTISEEEGRLWYETLFSYQVTNCRNTASGLGVSENMETILQAAADFVEVELPAA